MPTRLLRFSSDSLLARGVAGIAGLKVGIAAASVGIALAVGVAAPHMDRALLLLAHALAFAASGTLLVVGGRSDPRAVRLGVAFMCVASAFADHLVAPLWPRPSRVVTLARAVLAIQVDAFTPYFIWGFAREFPRTPSVAARDRWIWWVIRACFAVGTILLAANTITSATGISPAIVPSVAALQYLSRHSPDGVYWGVQLGLVIAAICTAGTRARRASGPERRRVGLLAAGLLVGATPTLAWSLLATVPAFFEAVPLRVAGWVIYPTLLSTPFSTAYAVLVHHALDVRVVIRRAVRYAFAWYTLLAVAAAPLVALIGSVYSNRRLAIADLLSSPRGALLGALALLAVATWRTRDVLLTRVDQHFFPEQRRSEELLLRLVADCSHTHDRSELAIAVRTALDAALRPDSVHVLFRDDRRGAMVAAGDPDDAPPVDIDSALCRWLAQLGRPADVDLDAPDGAPSELGLADRAWLVGVGARLLVPVRNAAGVLVAVVALGERKSELPYSGRHREILVAVAAAMSMALASFRALPRAERREHGTEDLCAVECPSCGRVYAHHVAACVDDCPVAPRAAMLPLVVAGKFAIEQRVGAGAMGVVYRGTDLTLGRAVAIKTLPFVSTADTRRMRHEARAMAAVRHENLALIYTAEVWHDRPMLVVEYLGGGTLADRLANGPVQLRDGLALGIALTSALDALHRDGVVHGDVKPSNIGFATDGTPKLLDFGLAHVLPTDGAGRATTVGGGGLGRQYPERVVQTRATQDMRDRSGSRSVAFGTPRYMAPEARLRARPAPVDDLWSVCVVLYEAVVGRYPFAHQDQPAQDDARSGGPDTRPLVDAGMTDLAAVFRDGLAADVSQRPVSAEQLRGRLLRLWER